MTHDIQIANHIKDSALFVTFISENLMDSADDEEDHCIRELAVAVNQKVNRLAIFLDDAELKGYYIIQYGGKPLIFRQNYRTDEEFIDECVRKFRDEFGIIPNGEASTEKEEKSVATEDDIEKALISGKSNPKAYDGNDPYIYVGYAHKDINRVLPEIERFQKEGFNVWYDEGIPPGNEWLDAILEKLENCDVYLLFVTSNSVKSENLKKELKYALVKGKNILPIYLDDFDSIEMESVWTYKLANIQGIIKPVLNEEEYIEKCISAFKNFGLEPNGKSKPKKNAFISMLLKRNK